MNCISTTQYGYTPLVTAAFYGKFDVVIELLDNGADINTQTDVSPINTVTLRFLLIAGTNFSEFSEIAKLYAH